MSGQHFVPVGLLSHWACLNAWNLVPPAGRDSVRHRIDNNQRNPQHRNRRAPLAVLDKAKAKGRVVYREADKCCTLPATYRFPSFRGAFQRGYAALQLGTANWDDVNDAHAIEAQSHRFDSVDLDATERQLAVVEGDGLKLTATQGAGRRTAVGG